VPILRVLMLHHSLAPAHGSLVNQFNYQLHRLDPTSETNLRATLAACQIKVMLTGHLHHHHVPSRQDPVKEFRCGTTTQGNRARAAIGYPTGHGFLLHGVSFDPHSGFAWELNVYERLQGRGFQHTQRSLFDL
jgi:hypothetical protein